MTIEKQERISFEDFDTFMSVISEGLNMAITNKQRESIRKAYDKHTTKSPNYAYKDMIIIDGACWHLTRANRDFRSYTRTVHDNISKEERQYSILLNTVEYERLKEYMRESHLDRFVGYCNNFEDRNAKGEDISFRYDGKYYRGENQEIDRACFLTTKEIELIDDITISGYKKFKVGQLCYDKRNNTIHKIRYVIVTDNQLGCGPFTYIFDNGDLFLYSSEVGLV